MPLFKNLTGHTCPAFESELKILLKEKQKGQGTKMLLLISLRSDTNMPTCPMYYD